MAIAISLKEFLSDHHASYEVVSHRHSDSSFNTAAAAHLSANQVIKAVILQNSQKNYLMAVLPADHRLALDELNRLMGIEYQFVSEYEIETLFKDCESGAIPAIGEAYHMDMIVDDKLLMADSVYIEAGDHENLVKLNHDEYRKLIMGTAHANIIGDVLG